ncbi:exported protein of unknown function [Rhodovastum atsumiense]|uniref:hypothetical protein n=1 Tax=Rhodovastum atsumiense TaxID=504468 RepID=UPI00139F2A1C|nr:hypothetical protein [Rhodovastum atsumiense]CAH2600143.1 exported protein of unknown function [Rhodovastum atsumiense]
MRNLLLASAALLGLAVGGAYAQTTSPGLGNASPSGSGTGLQDQGSGAWTGGTAPRSNRSSNTGTGDVHSTQAQRLPTPRVGTDADPDQYLRAAQTAITQRRTGAAQEALERAQTRLLDRAVAPSLAAEPVADPLVQQLSDARQALGRGDLAGANRIINQVLAVSGGTEAGGGSRAGLGPADTGSPVGGGALGAGGGAGIGPGGGMGADGSGIGGPGGGAGTGEPTVGTPGYPR